MKGPAAYHLSSGLAGLYLIKLPPSISSVGRSTYVHMLRGSESDDGNDLSECEPGNTAASVANVQMLERSVKTFLARLG